MATWRRIGLAGIGAGVVFCALVPAATAAVVSDRPCYREGSEARFAGNGFQPGQPVTITLDGRQIGTQLAAANGLVAGRVTRLASIPRSEAARSLTMTQVSNPALTGTVAFRVTKVYVVTKPRRFRPGRRLRMRAGGFYGAGPTLYAHVRGPRKRNLRIGRVLGPCGKVSATRKVILKRGDPPGVYPTQFDTERRYRGRAVAIGFRKLYFIRRIIRFSRGSSLAGPPLPTERWVSGGRYR